MDLETLTKMLQKVGMSDTYQMSDMDATHFCLISMGSGETLLYLHNVVFEFKEGTLWRVRKW